MDSSVRCNCGAEPVGEVYTMEALVPGGGVKHHVTLHRPLPAGTKLYTAPAAAAPAALPAMTPELASILGMMCFQCVHFAQALRAAGHEIKPRAEDEQAAALYWMLGHYFRHGDDWRKHALDDLERMRAVVIERTTQQGAKA
jgi:hypothetical protein